MNQKSPISSPTKTLEPSKSLTKGSIVRIKKISSFWYNNKGTVINIEKLPNIRYPITVRFDSSNYINANTQNFSVEELVLVN